MNFGVAMDILGELLYGDGTRKEWFKYPTAEEPYRTEEKVVTEGGYIVKDGMKLRVFDLESKCDVFRLMGKWIGKEWFGDKGDYWCYQISAIHDSAIFTSCDDCICDDLKLHKFRNYVSAVELAVDFVFCDTGLPVAKEVIYE